MKNIDINDIKVSSRLDDVIKSASIEGYKEIKNKRRKKVKRSLLVASLGVAMFGAIFSNEISDYFVDLQNKYIDECYKSIPFVIDEYL